MNITSPTTAARLAARLAPNPVSGCLEWQGAKKDPEYGYGHINIGRRKAASVHRVAWVLAHGPIPDGKWVLHRCDNPACCNVDHLFLGGPTSNHEDMVAKGRHYNQRKTHCPQGHEYTTENTKIDRKNGHKLRVCRECARARTRRWRASVKEMRV